MALLGSKIKLIIIALILCLVSFACDSQHDKTAQTIPSPTLVEKKKPETKNDTDPIVMATQEYVYKQFPGWRIKGIARTEPEGLSGIYIVGVDMFSKNENKIVNVVVRLFISTDNDQVYWKAEPLKGNIAEFLGKNISKPKSENDDE